MSPHLSLWYAICEDAFWSIIDKSLATTSIHRILGHPRGHVLFILSTNTFLINWPFAFYAFPNHYSRLLLAKQNSLSSLLQSLIIFFIVSSFVFLRFQMKFAPYMICKTIFQTWLVFYYHLWPVTRFHICILL